MLVSLLANPSRLDGGRQGAQIGLRRRAAKVWPKNRRSLALLKGTARLRVHNATVYEYLAKHGELGVVFNRFMTAQSKLHNAVIVDLYDFSGVRAVVTSAEVMVVR